MTEPTEVDDMERRVRLVLVKARDIIAIFNGIREDHDYLSLPEMTTLPKDYRVLAVRDDFESDGFVIKVWSAEFPPIPEGGKIPYIPAVRWDMKQTTYRRVEAKEQIFR